MYGKPRFQTATIATAGNGTQTGPAYTSSQDVLHGPRELGVPKLGSDLDLILKTIDRDRQRATSSRRHQRPTNTTKAPEGATAGEELVSGQPYSA